MRSLKMCIRDSYEDGTVVKGLYASGEVTWQSGGYSQSVVFGKVAGENAAAELK